MQFNGSNNHQWLEGRSTMISTVLICVRCDRMELCLCVQEGRDTIEVAARNQKLVRDWKKKRDTPPFYKTMWSLGGGNTLHARNQTLKTRQYNRVTVFSIGNHEPIVGRTTYYRRISTPTHLCTGRLFLFVRRFINFSLFEVRNNHYSYLRKV
jgi:hypothetical protein